MQKTENIRVRFAPSPTGHLHIGGVRTALFNFIFARHNQGAYTVRIEDTDLLRSTQEYLNSQLASLAWLKLLPDEPLVYQHGRIKEHQETAEKLIAQGRAYRCYCPPADAQEVIDRLDQGIGQQYNRHCRNLQEQPEGKPFAIRFKIPDDCRFVAFVDEIRGKVTVSVDALDDFVIVRQDGSPVYNFCVVIDDIFMKISHVIRGDDHLSNTFKQVLLYQACDAPLPIFAHLPLILGKSGGKLSKRDAAVSVEHYREIGIMADALCNYLVRLGWSYGDKELFTRDEMIEHFSFEHVGKKGAMFDMQKLLWMNGLYIRQSSIMQLEQALDAINPRFIQELKASWDEKQREQLFPLYQERATTLIEIYEGMRNLSLRPQAIDLTLIKKWHTEKTGLLLKNYRLALLALSSSELSHEKALELAKQIVDAAEEKLVALAQPIRLALTGSVQSPGVFELITLLGIPETILRIEQLEKQLL